MPATTAWLRYFDAATVTRLSHLGFKPASLVEGHLVGNHRSPFHGFAIEFAGHRQYVPGDDTKHLDWRAYYRTNKYLIKQYEQETNFTAHVVLDISQSMQFEHKHGRKLDYASFIAVALAQLVINQSDTVGAHFFDNELRTTIPVSGAQDIVSAIGAVCGSLEPKAPSAIGHILTHLAEHIGRRRVIFLISDFYGDVDETFRGLKRLLDDKHELVLLHLIDPLELDFDIAGRVRLPDLEGEGALTFVGHTIRDAYNEIFHAFLADLRQRTLALGIDYVPCSLDRPFGFHLAEYLSRRNLR